MIKKIALLVSFAFCGALAIVGWNDAMAELPNYIAVSSISDCTFECSSRAGQVFWSVAVFSGLFTACAVGSLIGFVFSFEEEKPKVSGRSFGR